MQYLLSCPCGKQTPVASSQAGETVRCKCGELLEVPTLRGLRQLPVAEEPGAEREAAGQPFWSLGLGLLFVSGVALTLISLVVIVSLAGYISTLETEPPEMYTPDQFRELMSDMTADRLWDSWTQLRDLEQFPLRQPSDPPWIAERFQRSLSIGMMVASGLIGALGIAMAGAAISRRGKSVRS